MAIGKSRGERKYAESSAPRLEPSRDENRSSKRLRNLEPGPPLLEQVPAIKKAKEAAKLVAENQAAASESTVPHQKEQDRGVSVDFTEGDVPEIPLNCGDNTLPSVTNSNDDARLPKGTAANSQTNLNVGGSPARANEDSALGNASAGGPQKNSAASENHAPDPTCAALHPNIYQTTWPYPYPPWSLMPPTTPMLATGCSQVQQ